MPDNMTIQQELRENNPFMSSVSPLPWKNDNPDLVQLNQAASEEIEQLIRHKRRQPSMPLAGLILGEPGSGKTHMLTRILRKLRLNERPAVFVTVRTFRNHESVIYDLLSEILISLSQFHSSNKSQFDMLVTEIMTAYQELRRNDGFSGINNIDMRTYMARDMPGLDRNVLKCLMLYSATSDQTTKTLILEWLREGLDEEEALKLGLPVRDVNSMSDSKRESEAEKILISLGLLLGYAHVPMIICFDQLDAIRDNEAIISALGDVINLLVNDLSGVLPLCFVRPTIWNDDLSPKIDTAVRQRLEHHKIIMSECTLDQAKLLIHDRIAAVFSEGVMDKYKWLIARLDNVLKPGFSPRMVIELANRAIFAEDKPKDTKPAEAKQESKTESKSDSDSESEIFRTIQNVYNEECKKVKSQPSSWPPNAENLALALRVWLASHEGFELSEHKRGHLKIQGSCNGKNFAFLIVTPKVHTSAGNALKQGIEILKNFPDTVCFYISEAKTHKKTWKHANSILQDFMNSGGRAFILDNDERGSWYGLAALINRIDNGDVDLFTPSGQRPATRDDIKDFVRTLNLLNIEFSRETKTKAKVGDPPKRSRTGRVDPDTLGNAIVSIVNSSPMKIIAVKKTLDFLSERGIKVSESELLSFLENNKKVFKTYKSKNDVLISLTEK